MEFNVLKVFNAVMARPMDPGDKLVLLALLQHADAAGEAYPGTAALAAMSGLSRRSVFRCRERLLRSGLVQWTTGGPGRANRYRILRPEEWPSPSPQGSATQTLVPDGHQCQGGTSATQSLSSATVTLGSATQTLGSATVALEVVPQWHPNQPITTHEPIHEPPMEPEPPPSPPKKGGRPKPALSDPNTRSVVERVFQERERAGISGGGKQLWASYCQVVYRMLNSPRPPDAGIIPEAVRWALTPAQAKYHARRAVAPRLLPELVGIYEAQVVSDGLDWSGVPPEDVRRYRKPGHKLTQAQVDVLKLPVVQEVVPVPAALLDGLRAPPVSGVPP